VDVLDVIIGSALSMGLTYTFVRCDRLRIPRAWNQRGWNAATTGAAIFTFAPLCIVAHFWVTRRSLRGLGCGVGALVLLVTLQVALTFLYEAAGVHTLLAAIMLQPILLPVIPLLVVMATV